MVPLLDRDLAVPIHQESDIQEFENETQLQEQENQIVVSTTINNKSTDNSMVSNKEIEEEEISKTKSGRKRIRSSTGEEDSLVSVDDRIIANVIV